MAQSPHSSLPSPAVADSPPPLPDLDTLVSHLVAAKRSLSSINHVWRANEIVRAARSALEESVILSARTGFLRRGLDDQLRLLYDVRAEVEDVAIRGRSEFSTALKELDSVDEQLKRTLDILRETTVEPAFRPPDESPKSLHDFVDERGVEELQSILKDAIDNTNTAQADLVKSNGAFDDDLRSIRRALGKYRKRTEASSSSISSSSPSASHVHTPDPSLLPDLLRSLESHAQEMAGLLESLVRHYDLCVTAIKHTEGGGAAAQNIAGDLPSGVNVDSNPADDAENARPLEPLTRAEYHEMLTVLTKDAGEADDVVLEIQDRISEMEATLERVVEQRDALTSACTATTEIFHRLSKFASTKLPGYVGQTHIFSGVWKEEHERVKSGMADLTDLRGLYIGFLDAYDGLILEAERRKKIRLSVEEILRDARSKLDQLYDDDLHARERFRVDQGDYLPSDIWPNLGKGPMNVEFRRVFDGAGQKEERETEEDVARTEDHHTSHTFGDDDSIPDLPHQAVQRAMERVKMRSKPSRVKR